MFESPDLMIQFDPHFPDPDLPNPLKSIGSSNSMNAVITIKLDGSSMHSQKLSAFVSGSDIGFLPGIVNVIIKK